MATVGARWDSDPLKLLEADLGVMQLAFDAVLRSFAEASRLDPAAAAQLLESLEERLRGLPSRVPLLRLAPALP